MGIVSVIIPCYNAEHYIDRLCQSLRAQTVGMESLEIIFVNDASTDATLQKLKRFESEFPEHTIVVDCKKKGNSGAARNIALEYASGDYITFVDADDCVHPSMTEMLVRAIEENDAEISECGYADFSGNLPGYGSPVFLGTDLLEINTTDERRWLLLYMGKRAAPWGRLYRAAFIRKHCLFFPEGLNHCEDCYFAQMCAMVVRRFAMMETPLYYYYHNENGLTFRPESIRSKMDAFYAQQFFWEEVLKRGLTDDNFEPYRKEIEYLAVSKILIDPFLLIRKHNMPLEDTPVLSLFQGLRAMFPTFLQNEYVRSSGQLMQLLKELLEGISKL